jgi:hypothetical protein
MLPRDCAEVLGLAPCGSSLAIGLGHSFWVTTTALFVLDIRHGHKVALVTGVPKVRLTQPTLTVIGVLQRSAFEGPLWGLQICRLTDLGPGTVYPILDRLVGVGWLATTWEQGQPSGRPRRCFYEITAVGRSEIAKAREARATRRSKWLPPLRPATEGGTTNE